MKYHTTAFNIVASLAMLLIVLVLVVVFNVLSLLPNYAQSLTDSVLGRISGSGDLVLSISSVDSSLFTGITIYDPKLSTKEGDSIATADSVSIRTPIYRFLWSALYPKNVSIEVEGLAIDTERGILEKYVLRGSTSGHDSDEGENLESLLAGRTITVTLSGASINVTDEQTALSADSIAARISLEDAMVSQGRISTGAISFVSDQIATSVQGSAGRIETTSTGNVQIHLNGAQSTFSLLKEQEFETSLERWGLSFAAESYGQLTDLSGLLSVDLTGLMAQAGFSGDQGKLTVPKITADIQTASTEVTRFVSTIPAMTLLYETWESSIEEITVTGEDLDSEERSIRITSPSFFSVMESQTVLAEVLEPEIYFLQTPDTQRIQFDAHRLMVQQQDHPLMESLLGKTVWDRIFLNDTYLLIVQNRATEEVNIESSAQVSSTTFIPYLKTVHGEVSASLSLDRSKDIVRGQLFVDTMGSDELPGLFNASLLYLPDVAGSEDITAEISHTNGIHLALGYNIDQALARLTLRLNQMRPYEFNSVIQDLSPNLAALVESETSLQGNVSLTVNRELSVGRVIAELGVANLAVEDQRFNIATTITGALEPEVMKVDLATLTTEGYRLSFQGSIDRTRFFPEGALQISQVDSGITIAAADFTRLAAQRYAYRITSVALEESNFAGDVSWESDGELNANGVLTVPGAQYPVSILFDQSLGRLTLDSDSASAEIDLYSTPGHITFDLALSSLELPPLRGPVLSGLGIVNGTLAADFSLAEELFILTSPQLQISGLAWSEQPPFTFSLRLDADPQEIRFDEILYEDSYGELAGSFSIRNRTLVELLSSNLHDFYAVGELQGEEGERFAISFFPNEKSSSKTEGILQLDQINLGRFLPGSEAVVLNASLVGETDLVETLVGHGIFNLDLPAIDSSISAHVHAEQAGLLVEDGLFTRGGTTVAIDELFFSYAGRAESTAHIAVPYPIIWRDATTRATVQLSADLTPAENLFSFVERNFVNRKLWPELTVSHSNVLILGEIPWQSGTHTVSLSQDMIEVTRGEGGTVEGSYAFDSGEIQFDATRGFPIPLRAEGRITDQQISVMIRDLLFDITHINAVLLEPIITFEGGLVTGSLMIDGPLSNPDYYGSLTANSVELTTFWTTGELFSLKNPVITISENSVTVAPSVVSAVHTSGRRARGAVQLEASIEQWGIPHYRIDILEMSNPISLWIPLIGIDVNVDAMVSGSFSIDGTPTEETLYGDVIVSDALISFGLPPLPVWVQEKERTSINMTLRTGRNVSFIFPNEEAPILRATFADDQAISIAVEAPSMATSFSGELAFRSGEIYYVQKNFYITEGSLRFPPTGTGLTDDFMPRISLRARLREFDTDGNRIDIYLVLQESRFDELDPRFESVPMRSTNEILELLGQNIVSMGADRETGATSVVAVASAATDVISRLGLLQATTISLGFSNIIRESLGLDVFTIRTNLLQNILLEALPGVAADTGVSPIARYLDNTTMYIGKYLLDDFYLQGMLHFRRDYFGSKNTFLASDLRIDTELSVEWTNPLATFSFFTQPEELSVFDLFDTMGFSITKRFEF